MADYPEVVQFRADFSKYVADLGDRMDELARNVAFKLAESVIMLTPRDTGFAANSWMCVLGSDPGDDYRQPPQNPDRKADVPIVSLSEAATALLDMKGDETVWITSNCQYMIYLEHGTSKMAPVGMIALTVQRIRDYVDQAAEEMLS